MLTTTYEMLQKAYEGHYAVPVVNTQGEAYGIIRAVCMTAEEFRSPVILAHYVNTGAYSGRDWLYETAKWMADKVSVPVIIHLDHGDSFGCYMKMSKLGFIPIMFDGFAPPVEGDAAATEAVARVCRSFGAPLEAGIGKLCRLDDRGNKIGASNTTGPDVVRQYPKLCHSDSLAIDTGNAREFYSGPVDIRVKVLEECRKFTDIPFILHGCTGMDEELVERPVDSRAAKVNFGIQARYQRVNYLEEGLAEGEDQGHVWKLSQYAGLRLHEDIEDIIRFAGSEEKA